MTAEGKEQSKVKLSEKMIELIEEATKTDRNIETVISDAAFANEYKPSPENKD